MLEPIKIENDQIFVLDQLKLPNETNFIGLKSSDDAFNVIKNMNVRGAPLIGFTGICGIALACREVSSLDELSQKAELLISARPTAVNLSFEVNQLVDELRMNFSLFNSDNLYEFCIQKFWEKLHKLEQDNRKSADYLIEDLLRRYPGEKSFNVITICNTGRLACGSIGTALGVISVMQEKNILGDVYACETRPYLQGSRLTSYELELEKIQHWVIPDGATSHVMRTKTIHGVFVGADRIANNGDTANKIGTSSLAIVSNFYKVPFYVVAPISSFDFSCESGEQIEIEYRPGTELTKINDSWISHKNSKGFNPSFDVTDKSLISGIACEKGLVLPDNVWELN